VSFQWVPGFFLVVK